MLENKKVLILSESDKYSANVMRCMVGSGAELFLMGLPDSNARIRNSSIFSGFISSCQSYKADNQNENIQKILKAIEEEGIDIISPSDYESFLFLAEYRQTLDGNCAVIPLPSIEEINRLDDKEICCKFVDGLNIDIPETLYVEGVSDLNEEDLIGFGYPIIVKTARGAGGEGVKLVDDYKGIRAFVEENKGTVLIQKYIDGVDYCFNAFVVAGEIKAWSIFRYVYFDNTGSRGQFVEFLDDKEIYGLSVKICTESQYTGPIVIDFRKDNKTSKVNFIEVNPRFGNNTCYSLVDGVNFFDVGFKLALNDNFSLSPDCLGVWSCSLKRLFTAPIRKLDLYSIGLIFKVGIPQIFKVRKQNNLLFK